MTGYWQRHPLSKAEGDALAWDVLRLVRAVHAEMKRDDFAPVDDPPPNPSSAKMAAAPGLRIQPRKPKHTGTSRKVRPDA